MILSGKAKLAGVMGWPVSHSRSPGLHGHWLERHGIDGAYVPLPVSPGHIETALRARGNQAVDGLCMLLHQAQPGFKEWSGVQPEVDEALRQIVLQDLQT